MQLLTAPLCAENYPSKPITLVAVFGVGSSGNSELRCSRVTASARSAPDMDSWAGIVAPAHTSPEVVGRLIRELRKIIDSPEIKSTLGKVGFEAFSSSPPEFADFIKIQLGKWGKMVKDAGIQPE